MLNATAEAPSRATKATPRTKAAPFPALASVAPEDKGAKPTSDEQFVAATLREQVVAICETRWDDLRGESIEVLHAAAEALEKLPHGAYKGLYRACSLVASALAVERESTPPGAAIPQLEAVYLSLDTASLGYNVEMEPHEAMAAGIRAGLRQFQDRPTSPIRRVETGQTGQVTAETFSCDAGAYGTTMVIRCAYDIEAIAAAVTNLGDEAAARNDEHGMAALLRCYGNRVIELNAMVISHLDRDSITLSDVQYALYRGAQRLPTGALE